MKKLLTILSLVLSTSAFADTLVGKIDTFTVLTSTNQGKVAYGKLKVEYDKKQAILQKAHEEISALEEKAKNDESLNELIDNKTESLNELKQKFEKELKDSQVEIRKPLMNNINVILSDISKSENVDFIYDPSHSGIIYVKKEIDLTDKVIKAYNLKFPN